MKYTAPVLLFFFGFSFTLGYVPFMVVQESLDDLTYVRNPESSRAYYGQLNGFPHTYQINSLESFALFIEVLVPDIASSKSNVSAIVVKEVPGTGRVEEIVRLSAKDAGWESFKDSFSGDWYRRGPSYESDVSAGTYRIEVNTPDNIEKYVLLVGRETHPDSLGFFEKVRRIAEVKAFFGKSQLHVVKSPFVYKSILIIFGLCAFCWYGMRAYTKRWYSKEESLNVEQ